MGKIAYIFILLLITMLCGCREERMPGYDEFTIKNSLQENIYYEVKGSFGEKIGEIGIGEKVYIGEIASHSTFGIGLFEMKIYTDSSKNKLLYNYVDSKIPLESSKEDGFLFNMTEDKIIK